MTLEGLEMAKKIGPYTMSPPLRKFVPGEGYVWKRERVYTLSAYGRTPPKRWAKRLGVKPLK